MKIELQKESKWEVTINDFKDYYWIRVDGLPLDLAYDEQSALVKYNAFKEKYLKKDKEILLSEDFDGELPESKLVTIETTIK